MRSFLFCTLLVGTSGMRKVEWHDAHQHDAYRHTWHDARAHAEAEGGRLPTTAELAADGYLRDGDGFTVTSRSGFVYAGNRYDACNQRVAACKLVPVGGHGEGAWVNIGPRIDPCNEITYFYVVGGSGGGSVGASKLHVPPGERALEFSSVSSHAFDERGVLHAIGTDWGTTAYANPADSGKVGVGFSDDAANYYSTAGGHKVGDARQAASVICAHVHPGADATMWSRGEPNAHFQIDLKSVTLRPTHFAYRGDYGGGGNHPRSFELQGSNDGVSWTTLSKHSGEAWAGQHVAKDWPICTDGYYRIFRVQNLGFPFHLCCSGIELYGLVRGAPSSTLALVVTGAVGEGDGVYRPDGTFNGKPRYVHERNPRQEILWIQIGETAWVITTDRKQPEDGAWNFASEGNPERPATHGWEVENGHHYLPTVEYKEMPRSKATHPGTGYEGFTE